jgi:hypothetical protein
MKNIFYLIVLSSTFLISCGAETEQEKEAAKDVLEVIKALPNLQKEVKKHEDAMSAKEFTGEFNAVIDGEELNLSEWSAQRTSIVYNDNSIFIVACADAKCGKIVEVRISHPNLYSINTPLDFGPSMFEPINDNFIHIAYKDRGNSNVQTFSGSMELLEFGDENIKLSFDGTGPQMNAEGSKDVSLKIELDLMYNFISQDERSNK